MLLFEKSKLYTNAWTEKTRFKYLHGEAKRSDNFLSRLAAPT